MPKNSSDKFINLYLSKNLNFFMNTNAYES